MPRVWLGWLTYIQRFVRRFVPWVVIDLPLVWCCYALALVARGTTADLDYGPALIFGLVASPLVVICNEAFGIYRRWWRYATSQDLVPLVVSVACATVLIVGADLAWAAARPMPLSAVFLGSFFSLCGMTAVRYRTKPLAAIRRTWRRLITPPQAGTTRVLIVGAGDAGQLLGWQLHGGPQAEGHHVVGFVDDDRRKHGMLIHGRQVLGDRTAIPDLVESQQVDLIVLAIHRISGRDFRDIVALCQETPAQIKVLPNVFESIRGDHGHRREGGDPALAGGGPGGPSLFGDITLEDLLGRHSVTIDRAQCRHLVRGKTILVTGASGSIGSELCRQLADLGPARLLMLDTNESGLHDLGVELQGYRSDDTALIPIVADVTHESRIRPVFARERPAVVFHAAAYKHVPLMEDYPEEAVRVNVGGTQLAMQLAAEYGVERFVLVSSDKAVEPSSVMGATKRVCELIGAAMPSERTLFTAVRFGNVLGSRGSVVPTFNKQIDLGGPVTITDPAMARYFMSVSEASSLIIQAASYTAGGDVFILDMGEELNVAELARRMIRLRGLRPDVDIPVVITGARPGEKLREVLTSTEERTQATAHPQVSRVEGGRLPCPSAELRRGVSALLAAARQEDRSVVRERLWAVAREGVAPPPSPARALAGVGAPALGAGGSSRALAGSAEGSAFIPLPSAPRRTEAAPWSASRAPLRVLADRVGNALAEATDRLVALEPLYVIPAILALLAYPNPLLDSPQGGVLVVGVVGLPWLARWARAGRPTAATPFDVPLGLFVTGALIGLWATTNGLWAGIRMSGILAGVALFYLIVNWATSVRRLRMALVTTTGGTVLGSLALLVLTAPYLSLGAGPGPWDDLIGAGEGWRQAVLAPDEALERYRFRASGVGGLATFGLALAVGPALAGARRSTRLAGYTLGLFFGAIVLISGHRGSLVSVAALGVTLLGLRNGWFLAAVPIVLVGLWAVVERGLFGLGVPDAQPLAVKLQFWRNAATLLHEYAWTGAGLGLRSVRDLYESYFLPVGPRFSHAHNVFIQAYLEQGLLGCAGLVGITATLLFYGRRAVASARQPLAWGTALSAGGAATVLIFEGLTEVQLLTSFGTVLLFLALGLLVAADRLSGPQTTDDSARTTDDGQWATDGGRAATAVAAAVVPRPWSLGRRPSSAMVVRWGRPRLGLRVGPVGGPILIGFVIALALALNFTPLGASLYLNLSAVERAQALLQDNTSKRTREQRLASSEAFLHRAMAIDDRDPALWRNLAEIAIARGNGTEARALLRRARELTHTGDTHGLFQLGRLYRESSFWQDALRAWREARAADALRDWATELRRRQQWDKASAVLLAVAELRPDDSDVHRQYVDAAQRANRNPEQVVVELERLAGLSRAPGPHVELIRLYRELGRPVEAAAARARASALGAR